MREADFVVQAEPGVAAIVIKPTLVGSLARCRAGGAGACGGADGGDQFQHRVQPGLTQLARIARWLTPDTVPGLDTLGLMQAQVLRPWPGSALPLLDVSALECLWRR